MQYSDDPAQREEDRKGVDDSVLGTLLTTLRAAGDVFATPIRTARDRRTSSITAHRLSVIINVDTIVLRKASAYERNHCGRRLHPPPRGGLGCPGGWHCW